MLGQGKQYSAQAQGQRVLQAPYTVCPLYALQVVPAQDQPCGPDLACRASPWACFGLNSSPAFLLHLLGPQEFNTPALVQWKPLSKIQGCLVACNGPSYEICINPILAAPGKLWGLSSQELALAELCLEMPKLAPQTSPALAIPSTPGACFSQSSLG